MVLPARTPLRYQLCLLVQLGYRYYPQPVSHQFYFQSAIFEALRKIQTNFVKHIVIISKKPVGIVTGEI